MGRNAFPIDASCRAFQGESYRIVSVSRSDIHDDRKRVFDRPADLGLVLMLISAQEFGIVEAAKGLCSDVVEALERAAQNDVGLKFSRELRVRMYDAVVFHRGPHGAEELSATDEGVRTGFPNHVVRHQEPARQMNEILRVGNQSAVSRWSDLKLVER